MILTDQVIMSNYGAADPEQRAAIERDTCAHWHKHVVDGTLTLGLEITTAIGQR